MLWKGSKYKMDATPDAWVAFGVSANCAAARFCKVQNTKLAASKKKFYFKE
jgi:hypothetical protein